MLSSLHPVIADPYLNPHDISSIASLLGGLSGAALFAGIVGGLIGWAASWKIDPLPAGLAVPLGIVGIFFILNIPV
jgi:hypothetical protein